jgi:hypothetical protein
MIKANKEIVYQKTEMLEKSANSAEFNDSENKEEFLDLIESLFIVLDEMDEILDADKELALMKQAVE